MTVAGEDDPDGETLRSMEAWDRKMRWENFVHVSTCRDSTCIDCEFLRVVEEIRKEEEEAASDSIGAPPPALTGGDSSLI